MACEGSVISCDATKTVVIFSPIQAAAELTNEGDIVTFELDKVEISRLSNHRMTKTIMSAPQEKWMSVTLKLFPCCQFYIELYEAYMADTMVCGDLVIDSDCCSPKLISRAMVDELGIKPVSTETKEIEVTFKGLILPS